MEKRTAAAGPVFESAKERYAGLGVDVDAAMRTLAGVRLSVHCWQGDDVAGFERAASAVSSGGLQVTGNFPGRARNAAELRQDLDRVYALLPGRHRLNLHAIYGEFGPAGTERDSIGPEHFSGWLDWLRERKLGADFNATCFSHPKAADGFTLSHRDRSVRDFWIRHVQKARAISAYLGKGLGEPCVHNLWIPDGSKDETVCRFAARERLRGSLDAIYARRYPEEEMKDSVESKLFGIGSESFVVGSHEFYLAYALKNGLMVTLDTGHFHPTESVADKIPALLQFQDGLLLHLSRGVRWDSDHAVVLNDELRQIFCEIVRAGALDRVRLALDYFDASVNRVGAWVIGARAALKAALAALLEPTALIRRLEEDGDGSGKLALLERAKTLPFGAVWDRVCEVAGVADDDRLAGEIAAYGRKTASERG
jgi:L-rhamnose isomerase